MVDPPHLGLEGAAVEGGGQVDEAGDEAGRVARVTELIERVTGGEVRGGGGEDVAAGERGARRRETVLGAGERDDATGAAEQRDRGCQEAVVGPEEGRVVTFDGEEPSVGPHT